MPETSITLELDHDEAVYVANCIAYTAAALNGDVGSSVIIARTVSRQVDSMGCEKANKIADGFVAKITDTWPGLRTQDHTPGATRS